MLGMFFISFASAFDFDGKDKFNFKSDAIGDLDDVYMEIKKHIKENTIKGAYLFLGEEVFVKNTYLNIVKDKVLTKDEQAMNMDQFSPNNKDYSQITNALDTLPFMSEKRLVIMKSMELLKKKNEGKVEPILKALQRLSDTTTVIICEEDMDVKSSIYQWMQENGSIVTFKPLDEHGLTKYICRELAKADMQIDNPTAVYLARYVGFDLTLIHQEIQKLISYKLGEEIVTRKDIEACCTKNIENKIYDIMNAVGKKEQSKAVSLYHDLLMNKEKPMRILNLIAKQFRQMLQCKVLHDKNASVSTITKKLRISNYVIRKMLGQTKVYTDLQLKQALKDCLDVSVRYIHTNHVYKLGYYIIGDVLYVNQYQYMSLLQSKYL
jgi:DNA polymerase-3 subunit delta